MMKMNTRAAAKFWSANMRGSTKGALADRIWTTKTQKPDSATASSIHTSHEANQSTSPPRSSISCSAPMPSASIAKPKKSKLRRRLGRPGR